MTARRYWVACQTRKLTGTRWKESVFSLDSTVRTPEQYASAHHGWLQTQSLPTTFWWTFYVNIYQQISTHPTQQRIFISAAIILIDCNRMSINRISHRLIVGGAEEWIESEKPAEHGVGHRRGNCFNWTVIAEIGFITHTEWQKSVKDYTARSLALSLPKLYPPCLHEVSYMVCKLLSNIFSVSCFIKTVFASVWLSI